MQVFTIREIDNHRIKSSKSSSAIMKTTDRGKRFKEDRNLSADDVFAANTEKIFNVKGKCKASMKREIRSMEVGINKVNCDIIFAKCSCPAGESGYCNHIMTLLFGIANYSLHQLISIPEEKACTSMARRWCVPSANSSAKQPIMDTAIRKNPNSKKGIAYTLYNPPVSGTDTDNSFTNRLEVLKQHFTSKSNLTGILAANLLQRNCSVCNETHYGNFEICSTLANHLRAFDETFEFLVNLEPADDSPVITDGETIFPEIPAPILITIFGVIFILETVTRKLF